MIPPEASEPYKKRERRRYAQLAAELHEISDRPEWAGKTWNWDQIARVLRIQAPTAQRLVQWMRKNYTETYWTVGTYRTDYLTIPTRLAREAIDGMLNQQRHLISRLTTMVRSWETLARIDPDPGWRGLAADNARHFDRMRGLEVDFRELLIRRVEDLGWTPPEREIA